ncbi:MAG: Npun_R1517 family heterocyst differentiation transcriptional regulator [Elainellaceae cyanobacterium]
MKSNRLTGQSIKPEFGVYECEIHLKFRLIEEKGVMGDREKLLELLLDAFACGADEYLEPSCVQVDAQEIPETEAPAQMRRQIIRLRNSSNLA